MGEGMQGDFWFHKLFGFCCNGAKMFMMRFKVWVLFWQTETLMQKPIRVSQKSLSESFAWSPIS
jgi:hypothetical protein